MREEAEIHLDPATQKAWADSVLDSGNHFCDDGYQLKIRDSIKTTQYENDESNIPLVFFIW